MPGPQVNNAASQMRLAGQVAVVTGGTRGIGYAIAHALIAEACNVVITGRDSAKLDAAAERLRAVAPSSMSPQAQAVPVRCDVRDAVAVERVFAEVRRRFGTLNVLVNNAGTSHSAHSVEDTDIELWRDIIDTNLTGTFLFTKFALPLMQRGGTILNVISIAAEDCFANYSAYNSAKAGALGFTRTLRQELKSRDIRVTALIPGGIDTDIWEQVMPDVPRDQLMERESLARFVLEAVLLSPKANLTELRLDGISGPF
jgi:NAD(P)-dependent dehydrogenase (short-subunit alcohol dehydrogenase family)